MTESKRSGPVQVGFPAQPQGVTNPVAEEYKQKVAQRAAQNEAERRGAAPIPDLNRAAAQHVVARDGDTTLADLAKSQQSVDGFDEDPMKRVLGAGTIAGLEALQDEVKKSTPTQNETPTGASPNRMSEIMQQMDDLELEQMIARAQKDLINNVEQQKIIDGRVAPMNLADGISTGEFKQEVPIKPGILNVHYRSVSPYENEEIRKMIFNMELEDKRLIGLTSERFSLMLCVASIVRINGTKLPTHVRGTGANMEFSEELFMKKFYLIRSYPTALIHALMTHSYWFSLRVNRLFVMDDLKNG